MKFLTRLRFDENGMKDLSGTSWENVGVTFDAPGKFGGKAARFDGTSYLKARNDEFNFGASTDFTVAMWIKYSNAKVYCHQTLLGSYLIGASSKLGYEYCGLYSSVLSDGVASCRVGDKDGDRLIVSSNAACDDTIWHYLAITRCGNSIKLFEDGKLKSTNTSEAQMNFGVNGSTMIGWMDVRNGQTYYYVGDLDDVCVIKDRALWTKDFALPTTYLEPSSLLYKDTNGQVYGMKAAT